MYFIHSDWLGNERERTTVGALLLEYCSNLPFGDSLYCNGTDVSPLHFSGKERDTETALDYFGARYNASALGRFVSADPEEVSGELHGDERPQSWNGYAYALNNPMTLTDPDGELFCRPPNDQEQKQGVGRVCITDREYINGGDKYRNQGYVHFDSNLDTPEDRAAYRQYISGGITDVSAEEYFNLIDLYGGVKGLIGTASRLAENVLKNLGKEAIDEAENYVNLADERATQHILDGDPVTRSGGHASGTGIPGKSEFPATWSRDKIMHEISDVATDPASVTRTQGNATIVEGTKEGVGIRVVIKDGRIVTGFPTNLPRNPIP